MRFRHMQMSLQTFMLFLIYFSVLLQPAVMTPYRGSGSVLIGYPFAHTIHLKVPATMSIRNVMNRKPAIHIPVAMVADLVICVAAAFIMAVASARLFRSTYKLLIPLLPSK